VYDTLQYIQKKEAKMKKVFYIVVFCCTMISFLGASQVVEEQHSKRECKLQKSLRCENGHVKCRICKKCVNSRCVWGVCKKEHPIVWVNVALELPKNEELVMVLLNEKFFTTARLLDFVGWEFDSSNCNSVICHSLDGVAHVVDNPIVTHWKYIDYLPEEVSN